MSEEVDLVGGCVLFAVDLARLANFYQSVTGLKPVAKGESFVSMVAEGFELTVQQIPAAIASSITLTDPPTRRESSPVKIVYRVADIAVARSKAAELGGQLHGVDQQWEFSGMRVCDGWDPEGNIFQLRQSVS